jgi:uncharacterized protein with PQ loop repeat
MIQHVHASEGTVRVTIIFIITSLVGFLSWRYYCYVLKLAVRIDKSNDKSDEYKLVRNFRILRLLSTNQDGPIVSFNSIAGYLPLVIYCRAKLRFFLFLK